MISYFQNLSIFVVRFHGSICLRGWYFSRLSPSPTDNFLDKWTQNIKVFFYFWKLSWQKYFKYTKVYFQEYLQHITVSMFWLSMLCTVNVKANWYKVEEMILFPGLFYCYDNIENNKRTMAFVCICIMTRGGIYGEI